MYGCTEYTECQAFSPVVRIGSPTLSPVSESVARPLPPPPLILRWDTIACGRGCRGEPIRTKGQTFCFWYSRYSMIPLLPSTYGCNVLNMQDDTCTLYMYANIPVWLNSPLNENTGNVIRINGKEYLRPTGATVVVVVWFVSTETIETKLWSLQNC